jgi:hypothetical protein
MKFEVTNWPEYEAGLRERGSLTLWLTPEAVVGWAAPRRKTRGGQPRYSDLAIETALTLGLVFGLRLRQAEGLLGSLLQLMGLALAVPDRTTLSRRAQTWRSPNSRSDRQGPPDGPVHVLVDSTGLKVYGAGQWLEEKHGAKTRRGWRKLHLALNADSGEIIAQPTRTRVMPRRWPHLSIRSAVQSDGSPPMAPMMESLPTTQSLATAPMLPSSFRRASTRSNRPAINRPAKGISISRQSSETAG